MQKLPKVAKMDDKKPKAVIELEDYRLRLGAKLKMMKGKEGREELKSKVKQYIEFIQKENVMPLMEKNLENYEPSKEFDELNKANILLDMLLMDIYREEPARIDLEVKVRLAEALLGEDLAKKPVVVKAKHIFPLIEELTDLYLDGVYEAIVKNEEALAEIKALKEIEGVLKMGRGIDYFLHIIKDLDEVEKGLLIKIGGVVDNEKCLHMTANICQDLKRMDKYVFTLDDGKLFEIKNSDEHINELWEAVMEAVSDEERR